MPDQRNTQLPLLVGPKIFDSFYLSSLYFLTLMLTLLPLYSVPIPITYTSECVYLTWLVRLSFFSGMLSSFTLATLDNGLSRRAAPHACTVSLHLWL